MATPILGVKARDWDINGGKKVTSMRAAQILTVVTTSLYMLRDN